MEARTPPAASPPPPPANPRRTPSTSTIGAIDIAGTQIGSQAGSQAARQAGYILQVVLTQLSTPSIINDCRSSSQLRINSVNGDRLSWISWSRIGAVPGNSRWKYSVIYPRHATPRHATPRHATPRHVTQARKHDDEKTQGGDENKPTPCHPKGFCD
jgi:hypothetical protein